jgi:hypothetical protein
LFLFVIPSERWQKTGSFGFSALALCVGKNQMCLFVRWAFCMLPNGLNKRLGGIYGLWLECVLIICNINRPLKT